MYKRIITYEDFDGNKRTEEFLFHLTKAEVIQWLTCNGGYTLDQQLQRLYEMSRGRDIMDIFDDLLRRSYGKKSLDGRRFDKSDDIWKDFKGTEAYSVVFTELVTDAKKAGAFINAVIPASMAVEVNKIMADSAGTIPPEIRDYITSDTLDENGDLIPLVSVSNISPTTDQTKTEAASISPVPFSNV